MTETYYSCHFYSTNQITIILSVTDSLFLSITTVCWDDIIFILMLKEFFQPTYDCNKLCSTNCPPVYNGIRLLPAACYLSTNTLWFNRWCQTIPRSGPGTSWHTTIWETPKYSFWVSHYVLLNHTKKKEITCYIVSFRGSSRLIFLTIDKARSAVLLGFQYWCQFKDT